MQATPENRSDLLRETPLTRRALSVQALLLDMPRVPGKCLQEVKDQMYLGLRSATHDFNAEELPPTRRRHHAIYVPIRVIMVRSSVGSAAQMHKQYSPGFFHQDTLQLDLAARV